jgi:hypothetical protein
MLRSIILILKYKFQEPERVILTLLLHPLRREKGEIQAGYSYYVKGFRSLGFSLFLYHKASLSR